MNGFGFEPRDATGGDSFATVAALLAIGAIRHLRGENPPVSGTFDGPKYLAHSTSPMLEHGADTSLTGPVVYSPRDPERTIR
jgi:hypothetical protein